MNRSSERSSPTASPPWATAAMASSAVPTLAAISMRCPSVVTAGSLAASRSLARRGNLGVVRILKQRAARPVEENGGAVRELERGSINAADGGYAESAGEDRRDR